MSKGLSDAAKGIQERARQRVQEAIKEAPTAQNNVATKVAKHDAPLVRGGFYFPSQLLSQLDLALAKARMLLPDKPRAEISKSAIVQAALELAMEDLEARGADAELVKRLGR